MENTSNELLAHHLQAHVYLPQTTARLLFALFVSAMHTSESSLVTQPHKLKDVANAHRWSNSASR